MKKIVITLSAIAGISASLHAAAFVGAVINYTAGGIANGLTDPSTALGSPGPIVDATGSFPGVLSPFNPPYKSAEIVGIGSGGGSLTLQFSNFVSATHDGTRGIGVFTNVGLNDPNYPSGTADATASLIGKPGMAETEVSRDGSKWYALNGGAPITFDIPTSYFKNAGPYDTTAPANPAYSDFGKPFTGARTDFANETNAQIVSTLGGSAGGTWLDLSSLPADVPEIGYIRFSNVPEGDALYLDAVSINNTLAGPPVPEPQAWIYLVGVAGAMFGSIRRRRIAGQAAFALAAGTAGLLAASVANAATITGFGDIENWVGSGPNSAALVIDWNDGLNYGGATGDQSLAWGYRWSGAATGEQMFEAIVSADPRLVLNPAPPVGGPGTVCGIGYDLNGNGFTYVSDPTNLDKGHASDPSDHYREGWLHAGYWSYWNEKAATTGLPAWTSASTGFSRTLQNGSWDGWSWAPAPDFNGLMPANVVAAVIPEPAGLLAWAVLAPGLFVTRRKRV